MASLLWACAPAPGADGKPAENAAACQKPGQQCRLPGGALGVCERKSDGTEGFGCMPQH